MNHSKQNRGWGMLQLQGRALQMDLAAAMALGGAKTAHLGQALEMAEDIRASQILEGSHRKRAVRPKIFDRPFLNQQLALAASCAAVILDQLAQIQAIQDRSGWGWQTPWPALPWAKTWVD